MRASGSGRRAQGNRSRLITTSWVACAIDLQFLHGAGSRYWFEVRPNLNKTVADRLSRVSEDDVHELLLARLKEDGDRALFAGKAHSAGDSR